MRDKLINRLTDFIQFEKEVRAANSVNSFGFTVCNYLHNLIRYDVALLLVEKSGKLRVQSISGVSDYDRQSPLVLASEALCNNREVRLQDTCVHVTEALSPDVKSIFEDIHIQQSVTVTLDDIAGDNHNESGRKLVRVPRGMLVLIRSEPWQQQELKLLQQTRDVMRHALAALGISNKSRKLALLVPGLKPDWRWAVCALILISFIPVPQSVIADAEVTARTPVVVAAGLNGVVEEVLVRPNEHVKSGQLLVRFDSTDLAHRKNTLQQELSLAKERLRKARQHSLIATSERTRIAELESQIELKQLELEYVDDSISRLELRADSDGVALFSRQQDWMGRAVSTGEKIMEIASITDSQFEIWVAANDAIEITEGRQIKFFPDARPLQSVRGSVNSVGFSAVQNNSDLLAFRVLAEPEDVESTLRLGMKGTARLYGDKVMLAYHILRKPISAIRRTVGV